MGKSRKFLGTLKCLFLCTLLVCNVVVSPSNVKAMDFSIYGSELLFNPIEEIEKLLEENKSITEKCLLNGKKVALELNDLKNNKSEFRKSVRNVLNEYYSTPKAEREELENFTKYIDDSADKIVENYEEAEAERENQENLNYETGKVLVSFPNGTSREKIDEIVGKEAKDYEIIDDGEVHIAEDLEDFRKKRLEAIKDWKSDIVVEANISLEDTVERAENKFEKYDCVKSASENTFFEADGTIGSVTTNDDHFNTSKQWNMLNVNIDDAWNRFDDSDIDCITVIRIAVIDSGVQMNHKELKGPLMENKSVDVTQNNKKLVNCKDEKSATGQYTSAHGTSVAGVLAAKGNNDYLGAGVASIASDGYRNSFEIMAIKCDKAVTGRHISKGDLAKAINYAVNNGADVINISYSAEKGDYTTADFSSIETAVKKAIAAKVSVVCAAGNDSSTTVRYPAGFPGVIGVGATWKNGKLASYSNESTAVDIVAPGGCEGKAEMYVTCPTTINSKGYRYSQGTSFATPHVAGTVAMMLSIHYGLSPSQILSRLQNRSTSTVSGRINPNKKFKVLNAGKAVSKMKPGDES